MRDAHIGVLWEGTSNINALDIITRAVGKSRAHTALQAALTKLLDEATAIPAAFRDRLRQTLERTLAFAERVAAEPALEATRAASGERALSHHQRHPDDARKPPGPAPMRAARCMRGWCSNIA